jgi:ABC-type Fe3+/spermidine/putrescine transport system ATPase subunit
MPGVATAVSGDRIQVKLDSGVELDAPANGVASGERVHAVVRPEKLRIDATNGSGPDVGPSVEGIVEASVYLGTATQIVVGLDEDVRMTVLVPNASEAERAQLPGGGARVRLSWAPEHIHVVRESVAAPSPSQGGESG